MAGTVVQDACADCQAVEASLDIRKRRLCKDCFIRYVNSKVLKRMESYRFKNATSDMRRRLLLPLSGGISSLALLQVLDAQLKRQLASMNRTAYDLHVLLVDTVLEEVNDESSESKIEAWYSQVQEKYSSHSFVLIKSLSDVFIYDHDFETDVKALQLFRNDREHDSDFVRRILNSVQTATTRSDLLQIVFTRLVHAYAESQKCDSILWGHSDSRLAANALACVANGRGGSLPLDIGDHTLPSGVTVKYPLRDLFKHELELYANLRADLFVRCFDEKDRRSAAPVSLRNTSIDQLLTTYINSSGEKYPSIMANVVRTASKLQTVQVSNDTHVCLLCATQVPLCPQLCYGCMRIKEDLNLDNFE